MLAIIGGTSLMFADLPPLEPERVATPFGPAEVLCGDVLMLLRHQGGLSPHRINFRAQMAALALRGADRVVAVGSSGSRNTGISGTPSILVNGRIISPGFVPNYEEISQAIEAALGSPGS